MGKRLSYLYLIFLATVLVWLVFHHPPSILVVVILVFATVAAMGMGYMGCLLQDLWGNFLYHQRLKKLLGSMTLEEVLEQSPYKYGYVFQGDDGYRIWHKDAIYDFVQSDMSKKAAQMWIVKQYYQNNLR